MFRETAGNVKKQIPNLGVVRSSRAGGTSNNKGFQFFDWKRLFVFGLFGTLLVHFYRRRKPKKTTHPTPGNQPDFAHAALCL